MALEMTTRSITLSHHAGAKRIQPPTPHKESTQRPCQHPSAIAGSTARSTWRYANPGPADVGLSSKMREHSPPKAAHPRKEYPKRLRPSPCPSVSSVDQKKPFSTTFPEHQRNLNHVQGG